MARPQINTQAHQFREAWLDAATEIWRPVFAAKGYPLPEKICFAVAFTSKGLKSRRIGEHWPASTTKDGTHTIIIRADLEDPLYILGVHAHELAHAAAPPGSGHGPNFKKVMAAIGLVGKATQAHPGPELEEWLKACVLAPLGPIPHSRLVYPQKEPKARKPRVKQVKSRCCDCGYEASVPEPCFDKSGHPMCPECEVFMVAPDDD